MKKLNKTFVLFLVLLTFIVGGHYILNKIFTSPCEGGIINIKEDNTNPIIIDINVKKPDKYLQIDLSCELSQGNVKVEVINPKDKIVLQKEINNLTFQEKMSFDSMKGKWFLKITKNNAYGNLKYSFM